MSRSARRFSYIWNSLFTQALMGSTLEAEHLELIAAIITIGVALQRTSRSDKIPFPDKKNDVCGLI